MQPHTYYSTAELAFTLHISTSSAYEPRNWLQPLLPLSTRVAELELILCSSIAVGPPPAAWVASCCKNVQCDTCVFACTARLASTRATPATARSGDPQGQQPWDGAQQKGGALPGGQGPAPLTQARAGQRAHRRPGRKKTWTMSWVSTAVLCAQPEPTYQSASGTLAGCMNMTGCMASGRSLPTTVALLIWP